MSTPPRIPSLTLDAASAAGVRSASQARGAGIRCRIAVPLAQADLNRDIRHSRLDLDPNRGPGARRRRARRDGDFKDASRGPPERVLSFPRPLVLVRGSLERDRPRCGRTAWMDSKDAERILLCSRQRFWTELFHTASVTNQTAGLTVNARRASEILFLFQRIAYCLGDDRHRLSRCGLRSKLEYVARRKPTRASG